MKNESEPDEDDLASRIERAIMSAAAQWPAWLADVERSAPGTIEHETAAQLLAHVERKRAELEEYFGRTLPPPMAETHDQLTAALRRHLEF